MQKSNLPHTRNFLTMMMLAAVTVTSAFQHCIHNNNKIQFDSTRIVARKTNILNNNAGKQHNSSEEEDQINILKHNNRRRNLIQNSVTSALVLLTAATVADPNPSIAAVGDESTTKTTTEGNSSYNENVDNEQQLIEVYFGCGCFWHVQHEFVEAERRILKRSDSELTARAGYAGGKAGMLDGKVCYHNAANLSDYGSLGHGEVVRLKIPPSSFVEFAKEYFNLFDKKGDRPDQFGDRGSEYRNLVGIPGGVKSEYAKQLVQASIQSGDKLDFSKGRGSDPDARALAFVMDTVEYPFFVAEQYHQFHDGFNIGENYPNSYNGLAGKLSKEGSLGTSDCPNGMLGLGAFGL